MVKNSEKTMEIPSWIWIVIQTILFLAFIFMKLPQDYFVEPWMRLIGFPLVFTGLIIGIISIYDMRQSLNVAPQPLDRATLVISGVYKYIRHPMYTAVFLIVAGFAINSGSYTKILLAIVIIIFFVVKTSYEEKLLTKKYPKYKDYIKETGKYFLKI